MSVLNCLTASSEIKSEPDEELEQEECSTVDPLGPSSEIEVKLESDIGTEGPEETNNEDINEAKVMCPNCNCTFNISLASLSLNVSLIINIIFLEKLLESILNYVFSVAGPESDIKPISQRTPTIMIAHGKKN